MVVARGLEVEASVERGVQKVRGTRTVELGVLGKPPEEHAVLPRLRPNGVLAILVVTMTLSRGVPPVEEEEATVMLRVSQNREVGEALVRVVDKAVDKLVAERRAVG